MKMPASMLFASVRVFCRGALLALLASAAVSALADITRTPLADAYVRDGTYATTNFGTATTLVVKKDVSTSYSRTSFLKFDLSGLTGAITQVTLRVNGAYATAGGSAPIACYFVPDSTWTETGVNWNNQPALGTLQSTTTVGSTTQYWTWDVTAAAQSELQAGRTTLTFALAPTGTMNNYVSFSSREGTATPQIVVAAVADPTFSVAPGSYSGVQTVALTSSTPGATIKYTIDGTTPTWTSGLYYYAPVPLSVNVTETINAIAYAPGMTTSNVASGTYTINATPAGTPTFSVASGTYSSVQTVTMSSATSGATIYFTLDGTTPTLLTTRFAKTPVTLTVGNSATINAIAYKVGYNPSALATATYTISLPVAAPQFSVAGGNYVNDQTVALSCPTSGATIYYTTDGTTPSPSNGVTYTAPLTVNTALTLKAVAYNAGVASPVSTATYAFGTAQPNASPSGGTFQTAQSVTLSSTTVGASIRYTLDGTEPSETAGLLYSGPIAVSTTETLNAIAYRSGYTDSAITTGAFTISSPVATPTLSPAGGTFTAGQLVTLGCATSGATIRYTTDGSSPTSTSGTIYTGPIAVDGTTTINAIASEAGMPDSAVATSSFTINAGNIVLSPTADAYVRDGTYATTNFGTATTLVVKQDTNVGYNRKSFLMFDLTGIPSTSRTTLKLYGNYATSGGSSAVRCWYVASNAWTESGITWNTAPTLSTLLSTTTVGSTAQYWTWDVTSAVQSAIASGATTFTLALDPSATTANYPSFNSREATSNQPQLVVENNTVATPTVSVVGGTYTGAQTVTISCATSGATIRYTLDGSTPTASTGLVYTGPITIAANSPLTVAAFASGMPQSMATGGGYSINYGLPPGVAIFVDPNESGPVFRAVGDLQRDLQKVLGVSSSIVSSESAIAGQPAIVVTCTGAATAGYRDPSLTSYESHLLTYQSNASAPRVVLQGADVRGTIYAIYEFSDRFLNVPPLWFWASWTPTPQSSITIPSTLNLRFASPAVTYRAWFPNDTDALSLWMGTSTANPNFEPMFETLLRLKYDVLDVNSIRKLPTVNQGLTWARECRDRGIAVTFTHLAPFGADPADWENYWAYVVNQGPPPHLLSDTTSLNQIWTYYINLAASEGLTDVVQSICFRGHGDNGFWVDYPDAPSDSNSRASTIWSKLTAQIALLKQVTGSPAPIMRTVFYNEVQTFMATALTTPNLPLPPTDTNLIWNFSAQQRDHYPFTDVMNYVSANYPANPVGYYMSMNFYNTGSHLTAGEGPWKVEDNFRVASTQAGAGNLHFGVMNAGNVREFVLELATGGDLLWNLPTYDADVSVNNFCNRYFGAQGPQVADLLRQYYQSYWPQAASDFAGGFSRQYIFQDLRYARASEDLLSYLESRLYNANPFASNPLVNRGPSFYHITPSASGATTELGALLFGTSDSLSYLGPIVSSCDALYPSIPASGQPLFNDAIRQQAKFMYQANAMLNALAQAVNSIPNGDAAVLPHLYDAEAAVANLQLNLTQRTQGSVFGTWYSHEAKFGITAIQNRIKNAIVQYGGTP